MNGHGGLESPPHPEVRAHGVGRAFSPSTPAARKSTIGRAVRRALAEADRRYFDEAARAVERAEDPQAAVIVPYPLMPELEQAFRESVAASWRDSNAMALGMLRRMGKGMLLGAGTARGKGQGARGKGTARTGQVPSLRNGGTARKDQKASKPELEQEAIRIILEGEDLVVPQEAIARYARDRIPPLRNVISEERKRLCRDIVVRAAGDGLSVAHTMRALQDEGFGGSAWHRETIARTEQSTLYSQGSVARYRASSAVTGMRFVAVMDDRTTEECSDLNGRVFSTDDLDGVTPPLDFNCRSDLEPVMFDEDVELDSAANYLADPDTTNPAPGFGELDLQGFPDRRDLRDLYRPLQESERAELRELHAEIVKAGERRWGPNWWVR